MPIFHNSLAKTNCCCSARVNSRAGLNLGEGRERRTGRQKREAGTKCCTCGPGKLATCEVTHSRTCLHFTVSRGYTTVIPMMPPTVPPARSCQKESPMVSSCLSSSVSLVLCASAHGNKPPLLVFGDVRRNHRGCDSASCCRAFGSSLVRFRHGARRDTRP